MMERQTTHNSEAYSEAYRRSAYHTSSGYYMPGSSAVAPEYLYQEEVRKEERHKVAVKPKKKNETLQWIVTLTLVFAMGIAAVGEYVAINSLGYAVNQTKNELALVQSQNEKLRNQISAASGLQNVEMVAVNYMGMHKPNGQEIIYLSATE